MIFFIIIAQGFFFFNKMPVLTHSSQSKILLNDLI